MKKISLILTIVLLFSTATMLVGCETSSTHSSQEATYTEKPEVKSTPPTSTPKLPSKIAFLSDLDPVQIDKGAYSFTGYITGRGIKTLTITASNGNSIITSDPEILYHTYRRPDGSLGVIISDATDRLDSIRGIPFTFIYGGSGALMLLKSPY